MEKIGVGLHRVCAEDTCDEQTAYGAKFDASPPKFNPKIVIKPHNTSIVNNVSSHGGSGCEISSSFTSTAPVADISAIDIKR